MVLLHQKCIGFRIVEAPSGNRHTPEKRWVYSKEKIKIILMSPAKTPQSDQKLCGSHFLVTTCESLCAQGIQLSVWSPMRSGSITYTWKTRKCWFCENRFLGKFLGLVSGRMDSCLIFVLRRFCQILPPDFGSFDFVGKSAQRNPPGKCLAKSSKNILQKAPTHFWILVGPKLLKKSVFHGALGSQNPSRHEINRNEMKISQGHAQRVLLFNSRSRKIKWHKTPPKHTNIFSAVHNFSPALSTHYSLRIRAPLQISFRAK